MNRASLHHALCCIFLIVHCKSLIKLKYNCYPEIFEEWARSILKARKDLEVLENINGLYLVYIERVVGRLAREVAPAAHQGKLDLDLFSKFLR
jgi:hypothetical protein